MRTPPPEIGQAWEWPADDRGRGRRRLMIVEVECDMGDDGPWFIRFAGRGGEAVSLDGETLDEYQSRQVTVEEYARGIRSAPRGPDPWPPRGARLIGTLVMEAPTAPQHDPVVRALLAHAAIGSVTLIAENPTREPAAVNGFDMPPCSVAYAVTTRDGELSPEDRQGVAQTIYNKLAIGIATVGPEFEDVTTRDGCVTTIRFTIWETT